MRLFLAPIAFGLTCALAAGCGDRGSVLADDGVRVEAFATDALPPGWLTLPSATGSVKFAVIGDSGRGSRAQQEVAERMDAYRRQFPFTFVLMLGDNIYEGPATLEDYRRKFEAPYRALLAAGVRFYAVLGNHDDPNERFYPPFHMGGKPYYTFRPPGDIPLAGPEVRFFALNSTYMDRAQFTWLARELDESDSTWKIVLLHHPLYTSGRYRLPARGLRVALERSFVAHGVSVVFSGHEHFYERSEPQRGVQYFVSGGAGSLRRGDARESPLAARSFDEDYHFMLVEITDEGLYFQAISRTGATVDAGAISRGPSAAQSTGTADHPRPDAPSARTPAPTPPPIPH